jgi:hypothetical protein
LKLTVPTTAGPAFESLPARRLLLANRRFDLVIKRLCAARLGTEGTTFFRDMYLAHIRAFNNFYEASDPVKRSAGDYLAAFEHTFTSISERGFDPSISTVPVDDAYELMDGAHRTAIAAALDATIAVTRAAGVQARRFDYRFFRERGLPEVYSDRAALAYVRSNPDARIVTLHAVNPTTHDTTIETILDRHGAIFYKMSCRLGLNGTINLKKLCYSREAWIGTSLNGYRGARRHAEVSSGPFPLRVYVFSCDGDADAIEAKREIRAVLGSETRKHTVHITDTHDEARRLAEALFSAESRFALSARPYTYDSTRLDERLERLRTVLRDQNADPLRVCIVGSAPMEVFDLRRSRDLDILALDPIVVEKGPARIGLHDDQLRYYPISREDLILNPANHFFYAGFKFASLRVISEMKRARAERPKDFDDRRAIAAFRRQNFGVAAVQSGARGLSSRIRSVAHRLRRLRHWRTLIRRPDGPRP